MSDSMSGVDGNAIYEMQVICFRNVQKGHNAPNGPPSFLGKSIELVRIGIGTVLCKFMTMGNFDRDTEQQKLEQIMSIFTVK